jgi:hypothetical protein
LSGDALRPSLTDDFDPIQGARHARPLRSTHNDYQTLFPVVAALISHAGGSCESFIVRTASLIRRAVDEVIDTARTNRFTLDECEKTEKTYLGTKIENLFRNMLGVTRGKLDLDLDGTPVDVKNTMYSNWAIPREAYGHPCVLIAENEKQAIFSVGVIRADPSYLNPGRNQDNKASFSAAGRENIWWLARAHAYPPNPWEFISEEDRLAIMVGRGGTTRVAALFEMFRDRPISRTIVQHVGQQKDALRRVRRGGGARDILAPKGIAILYEGTDRALIARLGLPSIGADEFISHRPRDTAEADLLREARHID